MDAPPRPVQSRKLVLSNSLGLHARSAARIVRTVQSFDCQVFFSKDGRRAEGDSILALLTLNCPPGSVIEVQAQGRQAMDCLDELGRLFASNFEEE
ncbi:MAG: HPr family phosphocarrier protein [Deltaproteobacteria bacterium]|nr:HPr family phosphocarrier protein [Deltaproteobacteria bacterium]